MPTVISFKSSDGKRRNCNSRCHNAKRVVCRCICDGKNHRVGNHQATVNTQAMAEELQKQYRGVKLTTQVPLKL